MNNPQPETAVIEVVRGQHPTVACHVLTRGVHAGWRAKRHLSGQTVAAAAATAAMALLLLGSAPSANAQGSGNGFLFRQPSGSITINGGYSHATAGGDLFSFVTNQLTLDKGDFSGFTIGGNVALRVAARFDIVLSSSYSGSSTPSNYRDLVDEDNQEIRQVTDLKRVPLLVGVRAYLTQRGRSVGRFAWVPARVAPYVGIDGGTMWYRFTQRGDFVNADTQDIFPGDLSSSGWAPAADLLAGIDVGLSPRIALNGEAKYIYANGSVHDSFSGFDGIDLSGFSAAIGLTFRY